MERRPKRAPFGEGDMTADSLESLLRSAGDIVEFLRNQQTGPNAYPGVPAEYTNWRDEQRAWQKTACCSTRRYHMVDSTCAGRTRSTLLEYLGINSFKGFVANKAKQFVPVTPGRLRHRRRDPVLPRREPVQPGRPRAGDRMGRVPRATTGEVGRDGRARRAHRAAHRRHAQDLSLPAPGPERDEDHREGDRRRPRPTSSSST